MSKANGSSSSKWKNTTRNGRCPVQAVLGFRVPRLPHVAGAHAPSAACSPAIRPEDCPPGACRSPHPRIFGEPPTGGHAVHLLSRVTVSASCWFPESSTEPGISVPVTGGRRVWGVQEKRREGQGRKEKKQGHALSSSLEQGLSCGHLGHGLALRPQTVAGCGEHLTSRAAGLLGAKGSSPKQGAALSSWRRLPCPVK